MFVDDGSADGTWQALHRTFGAWPGCRVMRHEQNQGIAAAILTGIRHAETEVVCSIDADCTYDPHELANMIPLLSEEVDAVTASPYHPLGEVRNVPRWRLGLSASCSFLYRRVLRQKLATYTSCFRVYRKSAVAGLTLWENGFLGVTELLARIDLNGGQIVEYPATLEVRMLGRSKMKTVKTIAGHLKLMLRLLVRRLFDGQVQPRRPTLEKPRAVRLEVAHDEERQHERTLA
jgi:glycosyltransferase involved in cell wall biosynthesis